MGPFRFVRLMMFRVALLASVAALSSAKAEDDSVHVAFCAECKADMDWKSAGLFHSWHTSGTRGKITRLLACSEDQLARYPKAALEMGPTYVHRNYRMNPRVPGDHSGSYNKAASIMHFLQDVHFEETYVLYMDADMLIRRPIIPSFLGVKKGTVVSEHVMYLENGVDNGLVAQFSPDAKGIPAPVGWYHLFHRDDIAQIAPLWLHYCERMRTEPEHYWAQFGKIPKDIPTGDAFVRPGGIPWIAEMYGYVIAAAEVGVEHIKTHGVVKYAEWPEDHIQRPDYIADPYIIHNGIGCKVSPTYRFDKSSIRIDPAKGCDHLTEPPGTEKEKNRLKIQRYAPKPPDFETEPGVARPYNEQLCVWATNILNNGLCGLYRSQCGQMEDCPVQYETSAGLPAVGHASKELEGAGCNDRNIVDCPGWGMTGECRRNPEFMRQECARSCGACVSVPPLDRHPEQTFNGTLGSHVIFAKKGAPTEAAAPIAPKVANKMAAASAGAAEQIAKVIGKPDLHAEPELGGKDASAASVIQAIGEVDRKRLRAQDLQAERSRIGAVGALANRFRPGGWENVAGRDRFREKAAAEAAGVGGLALKKSDDVKAEKDIDGVVAMIRAQMLTVWVGVAGFVCCCLLLRAVQVSTRRRGRERKRRDVTGKHSA